MDDLKREGQQQNAEGKGQESKGQLNDLGSGVADRVQGTVGGAVAGLTGECFLFISRLKPLSLR